MNTHQTRLSALRAVWSQVRTAEDLSPEEVMTTMRDFLSQFVRKHGENVLADAFSKGEPILGTHKTLLKEVQYFLFDATHNLLADIAEFEPASAQDLPPMGLFRIQTSKGYKLPKNVEALLGDKEAAKKWVDQDNKIWTLTRRLLTSTAKSQGFTVPNTDFIH